MKNRLIASFSLRGGQKKPLAKPDPFFENQLLVKNEPAVHFCFESKSWRYSAVLKPSPPCAFSSKELAAFFVAALHLPLKEAMKSRRKGSDEQPADRRFFIGESVKKRTGFSQILFLKTMVCLKQA